MQATWSSEFGEALRTRAGKPSTPTAAAALCFLGGLLSLFAPAVSGAQGASSVLPPQYKKWLEAFNANGLSDQSMPSAKLIEKTKRAVH